MKRLIVAALCGVVLCAVPAWATDYGNIYIDPATYTPQGTCTGAGSPYSCCTGAGTGCEAAQRIDDDGATGNTPVSMTYFQSGSGHAPVGIYPFYYPHGAPINSMCTGAGVPWECCTGSGTGCEAPFHPRIGFHTSTSGGTACLYINICSRKDGTSKQRYNTYACGTEKFVTLVGANAYDATANTPTAALNPPPGYESAGVRQVLVLRRVDPADDGSCSGAGGTSSMGFWFDYVYLQYPLN